MAGRTSRNKGQRGEREVADIIYYATGIQVSRNLEQTRNGGHDLNGIPGVSIEVKRQEILCLPAWWRQTLAQAKRNDNAIPVLAYRQNKRPWIFLVGEHKKVMLQNEFTGWLRKHLREVSQPEAEVKDPVIVDDVAKA